MKKYPITHTTAGGLVTEALDIQLLRTNILGDVPHSSPNLVSWIQR